MTLKCRRRRRRLIRSGEAPRRSRFPSAMDMIVAAQRPVLFIGHGVTLSEASRELTEFAKKLAIPVISSPNGMGCLDMTDPLSLGFIGRNGAYPANEAGRRADLVIAIGARFDDRSASSWLPGFSWNFPHTKLIHVDVDPDELGRNYPPDLAHSRGCAHLSASAFGGDSTTQCKSAATKEWIADIAKWRAEWEKFIAPNFDMHTSPLRPERVVADCQAVLPPDGIICCDVGVSHNWYMQFWNARKPQPCSIPGAFPAWASALPARSAPSSRRRIGRWLRSPATAASPWCRTCFALRSNTTFPWSG